MCVKGGIHSMVMGVKSWAVQKDTKHNGVCWCVFFHNQLH